MGTRAVSADAMEGAPTCEHCGELVSVQPRGYHACSAPPHDAWAGEYRPEIEALIDAVKVWAIAGWRQPDALAVHGPLYAAVESAADALQAQYARSERAREELQTQLSNAATEIQLLRTELIAAQSPRAGESDA